MDSPAQMQELEREGIRPLIGTVGFVLSTHSLCVYTPLGWIEVEVCLILVESICFFTII